jgi:hypothetical protein
MAQVNVTKTLFRKNAVASDSIGGMTFTIKGEKRPLSRTRYLVLVDATDLSGRMVSLTSINGDFNSVMGAMKADAQMKRGTGLLRDVSEAIPDPLASAARRFTEGQLKCLAALKRKSMLLREIVAATGLKPPEARQSLAKMRSVGMVYMPPDEPLNLRTYMITAIGNDTHRALMEEKRFVAIQEKIDSALSKSAA